MRWSSRASSTPISRRRPHRLRALLRAGPVEPAGLHHRREHRRELRRPPHAQVRHDDESRAGSRAGAARRRRGAARLGDGLGAGLRPGRRRGRERGHPRHRDPRHREARADPGAHRDAPGDLSRRGHGLRSVGEIIRRAWSRRARDHRPAHHRRGGGERLPRGSAPSTRARCSSSSSTGPRRRAADQVARVREITAP